MELNEFIAVVWHKNAGWGIGYKADEFYEDYVDTKPWAFILEDGPGEFVGELFSTFGEVISRCVEQLSRDATPGIPAGMLALSKTTGDVIEKVLNFYHISYRAMFKDADASAGKRIKDLLSRVHLLELGKESNSSAIEGLRTLNAALKAFEKEDEYRDHSGA